MSRHFNPYAVHFGARDDDQEQPEDDGAFELEGDWTVIGEGRSGLAIRVECGDGEQHWIPKSQLTPFSECREVGDSGLLSVTDYLARERGWL